MSDALNVLVLTGGPDKERPVCLQSGEAAAAALRAAGHHVELRDIANIKKIGDLTGDVVLPMLHGPWGEGGPLQQLLEDAGVRYVGARPEAAALCIDKLRTKEKLAAAGLPTPAFEVIKRGQIPTLDLPLVIKAINEGSSFDLEICHSNDDVHVAAESLGARHRTLLAERFIAGKEITVGIVGDAVLPPIHIVPATAFYDYEAKYSRDDTQYRFEIDLPDEVVATIKAHAKSAHEVLGCRHLSRVDFMVDESGRDWIIEVNTMPGFTSHSLLPKAAARGGMDFSALCDRLVRMGAQDGGH